MNFPIFSKKKHFWTYLELLLLSINRFRDAFYEKFTKFRYFWKNLGLPFQKVQKIIIIEIFPTVIPFQKLSSKELLGIAIVKSIKFFLEKPHVIFQKAPTFELFQIFEAKNPFGSHCKENSPEWAILNKSMVFFRNTHLHFRKTLILELFEISWAVILHEPQARKKMPRLPFLRKLKFY